MGEVAGKGDFLSSGISGSGWGCHNEHRLTFGMLAIGLFKIDLLR